MAARTFTDSTGSRWEVSEVHRGSRRVGAVSAGLEGGWLSFVGESGKRRLAPFPADWADRSDAELATLCDGARRASPTRIVRTPPTATSAGGTRIDVTTHLARPEQREDGAPMAERLPPAEAKDAAAEAADADGVEAVVRGFTHDARASGAAAIETMVRLRTALQERFPGEHPVARDMRRVRRWFVDAFYFDREKS